MQKIVQSQRRSPETWVGPPRASTVTLSLLTTIVMLIHVPAHAKPMPSATMTEACQSPRIVVARYLEFSPYHADPPAFFYPPIATFEITDVLKGVPDEKQIRVRFDFHDGSPCMNPINWHFSIGMMPHAGSLWILYLTRSEDDGVYATYRGDFGRKPDGEKARQEALACNDTQGIRR